MESYIKGIFKKIIFKSNNNYIVGLFRVKDSSDDMTDFINKTITITGYFHDLNIDESYIMNGELVDNPKYGMQYSVKDYKRVTPEDKDGIVEFLSSSLFKGVGEKLATSIVNTLGEDALTQIEEDYTCLLLVPKMTNKKAKEINEILVKYNESYNTIVFLNNIGFTTKDSLTIYNYYKKDTIDIINNNVYSITDDLAEINFTKIEKVRNKLGIEDSDKNRIMYMIIYVMNNLCFNKGDTYLYIEDILSEVNRMIELSIDELEYYMYELQKKNRVIIDDNRYFLKEYYVAEKNISETLYYLTNKKDTKYKNINNEIDNTELYFDIEYNDEQRKAIKNALEKNLVVITGGPGTGKTTIIKGIVEVFKKVHNLSFLDLQNKIALLAPTGRAAKRMGEAALMPALTIHRFLKWNRETDKFMINEQNKSDVDFVIVDEVSMVDTLLLNNLLNGLKKDVKIVMIGDYNQLESVSPGKVLKDIIDSDIANTIKLTELYRQKDNSYISLLANEIKNNDIDLNFDIKKDDFNFYESDNLNIKNYITKLCEKAIEKGYNSNDIQVLAPMYKGENGIDNLNKILQNIFNPDVGQNFVLSGDVVYRENDKILLLENDPDNNVFNGDIGYIVEIEDSTLYIDFYGSIVKYTPKNFNLIKHGYAISIHKSQGSEFKLVFLPISFSYRIMLYKKIVYTAVTRARESLAIIGSKDAFLYAVNNNNTYERKTCLKEFLLECIN